MHLCRIFAATIYINNRNYASKLHIYLHISKYFRTFALANSIKLTFKNL